jgi:hypothetical protein
MKTNSSFLRSLSSLIALFIVIIIATTACKKDENADLKPTPELPPQASMVMTFSDFTDIDTTFYKSTETFKNWGWSALNVTVWNAVITVTLAVPVTAFYESFKHEGIYNPTTDEWIWSYNFFVAGQIHQASLHASLVSSGIHWKMFITKNNAYDNFLWYEGTTNPSNTVAEWHFNEKPANPDEILLIEYQKDAQTNIEQIKYTNVNTASPGNGGYIQYGTNTTLDFDAFYTIYYIEEENIINIEWSRTMKDGRVRDELHFGDFEWKCWDTDLQDIVCP